MSNKPVLRIYTAGGCGIKMAHNQIKIPNMKGYVKPIIASFDSSKSDVEGVNITNQQISYHFLDRDGMGKNRALAADIIRPEIKPFIDKNTAGHLNVVIFSLSGGTGSVAGLMMVKELLVRNENVVAMVVGDTSNQKEAINTLSTLNDLRKMPEQTGLPLSIMYYENSAANSSHHVNVGMPSKVDSFVSRDISALSCLVSGAHTGIDSKDITNLLNFQNVTKIKPRLVELCVTSEFEELEPYQNAVISLVVLTRSKDTYAPALGQTYEVKGTWASDILENDVVVQDLIYVTTAAVIPSLFDNLKKKVEAYQEAAVKIQNHGIVKTDDFDDLVEDIGI